MTGTPQLNARRPDAHETSADRPNIRSSRDLTDLCEVSDYGTGEVLRSSFTFVDADHVAWFGQVLGVRKYDLTVEDFNRQLCRVEDEVIYPDVTAGLTVLLDTQALEGLYLKRPKLLCLDDPDETRMLPTMLVEEARTLEIFKAHPHRHLVRYHGCVARRGRIVALALERYGGVLQYRFQDDPRDFDSTACMRALRDAVKHMHGLGFAHNDVNPMNIGVDHEDQPVLLDFGSCRRFGEILLSGGTPGWIDENFSVSEKLHDESALEKVEAWLAEKQREREDERCRDEAERDAV